MTDGRLKDVCVRLWVVVARCDVKKGRLMWYGLCGEHDKRVSIERIDCKVHTNCWIDLLILVFVPLNSSRKSSVMDASSLLISSVVRWWFKGRRNGPAFHCRDNVQFFRPINFTLSNCQRRHCYSGKRGFEIRFQGTCYDSQEIKEKGRK